VAVVTGDGTAELNKNVVNGSEPMLRLIGGLPAGTPVASGAAFGWGWLAGLLEDYGFEAHLVHPLRCKAIASARLKNDKGRRRDASCTWQPHAAIAAAASHGRTTVPAGAGIPWPSGPAGQHRHTYHDLMNAIPSPADWLAWWSWPWQAASTGASPFLSLAPQALNQPILPGWLFANSINVTEENSSSPETEQDIVAKHSYGQQLGRITDVIDELLKERPAGAPDTRPVREFVKLRNDIEAVKARQAAKRAEQMISDLARMKQSNPGEYQHLATELRKFLGDSGD
jgi:hypothetical protein